LEETHRENFLGKRKWMAEIGKNLLTWRKFPDGKESYYTYSFFDVKDK